VDGKEKGSCRVLKHWVGEWTVGLYTWGDYLEETVLPQKKRRCWKVEFSFGGGGKEFLQHGGAPAEKKPKKAMRGGNEDRTSKTGSGENK